MFVAIFFFALILLAANIFTLGLPGSILFSIGDKISLMLLSENSLGNLKGDEYSVIYLIYGLIWPLSLPIFYSLSTKFYSQKILFFRTVVSSSIMFIIVEVLYTIILAMLFRTIYSS